MITIEEALQRILSYVSVLGSEDKHPLDALGQVLDQDLVAGFDIPPLPNTSMDGYAVRAADTDGASPERPRELDVIGEVAAGYLFDGEVLAGQAVRIMTGAPIPAGADSVVPFEETDEPFDQAPAGARAVSGTVRVFKAARPGNNIREAGQDVRRGQVVLPRGTVLRPADIGVIASLGLDRVLVIRRPIIGVLSTGDELVDPGQPLEPGRIYDANQYSIAALVERFGGVPMLLGVAKDDIQDLTARVHEGLSADMLVTSAGVSRGDYDIVKDVLAREGEVAFWTVAMKPGKPLAFGAFQKDGRRVPHIGLPGNPVSSMVAFELFGRPAILKMMGKTDWRRPIIRAISEDRIENVGDRRAFYARCIVTDRNGTYYARLTGAQGSGMLTSMAMANGLAMIPADVDVVEPGEQIDVLMLDWSRGEDLGSYFADDGIKNPRSLPAQ
jgi:molybdopterin molybdotransferase